MPKPANKPIIAVDMDDVLFPLVDDLIEYVDQKHKVKITREEFINYDIRDIWAGGPIEGDKVYEDYKNQTRIEIAPLKGAQKALTVLAKNHEIILMTARDIAVEAKTKDWLIHHFPNIFEQVHFVGNKKESLVFRPKAEVCLELGVSYLIDDRLRHILETNEAGIEAILFGDYPWNQAEWLPEGIARVKNWQEVLDYFDARG